MSKHSSCRCTACCISCQYVILNNRNCDQDVIQTGESKNYDDLTEDDVQVNRRQSQENTLSDI